MYLNNCEKLQKIVFCDTSLNITSSVKEKLLVELHQLPEKYWYWCTYRNCFLLLLYGNNKITNKEALSWTDYALEFAPGLVNYIESEIRPHFKILPRIIVLKTKAGGIVPPHIDCNPEETGTFNPKLRINLSGNSGDLEFLSERNGFIQATPSSNIYYMSGAYTHRLINKSNEDRLTVCFGAPWTFETANSSLYSSLLINESNTITDTEIGHIDHSKFSKDWEFHKLIAKD